MKCGVRGCPHTGKIVIEVEEIVRTKKKVCQKCFDRLRPAVREKRTLPPREYDFEGDYDEGPEVE